MSNYSKIVLNIPHASEVIPVNTWEGDIWAQVRKWTDKYTDVLFAPAHAEDGRITPVVCHVSRFFCDVERLVGDPLETRGEGIFYTNFGGCTRKMEHAVYSLAMQHWWKHQERLAEAMEERCLVIDCHSFPCDVAPDVDFCIGFNEDSSKPRLTFIEKVCRVFEGYGYSVSLNKPYSNSITPHNNYFYHSLMVDVNKRLYLDTEGGKKGCMYKINQALNYLYQRILEW